MLSSRDGVGVGLAMRERLIWRRSLLESAQARCAIRWTRLTRVARSGVPRDFNPLFPRGDARRGGAPADQGGRKPLTMVSMRSPRTDSWSFGGQRPWRFT
jgi:hypothetical protein